MRVPTSDLHAANACWSLFLLFTYLVVAEAASFDKKELCRSDTLIMKILKAFAMSLVLESLFGYAFSSFSSGMP